jgi:hypothetical protein
LLPEISTPTLVISGLLDVLTPAYQSFAMARNLRHAEHVCCPFASHAALLEDPERVIAAVDRHLSAKHRRRYRRVNSTTFESSDAKQYVLWKKKEKQQQQQQHSAKPVCVYPAELQHVMDDDDACSSLFDGFEFVGRTRTLQRGGAPEERIAVDAALCDALVHEASNDDDDDDDDDDDKEEGKVKPRRRRLLFVVFDEAKNKSRPAVLVGHATMLARVLFRRGEAKQQQQQQQDSNEYLMPISHAFDAGVKGALRDSSSRISVRQHRTTTTTTTTTPTIAMGLPALVSDVAAPFVAVFCSRGGA